MPPIEYQTTINAEPAQVFARVADLKNHAEWSGVESIRKVSEGPVGKGTVYETEEEFAFGRTSTERSVVSEYEPNTRFGWRTFGPLGTWLDWSMELRAEDGHTRLTQRLVPKGGVLTAIAMRLFIERQMRASMPETLAKFKDACERS